MKLLLSDLDGVIRHFPDGQRDTIERRFGLPGGSLMEHAFEEHLLHEVITGRRTRASWTEEIGRRVGSPEAATTWLAERGAVDHDLLGLYDQVRQHGHRVAVLTNGTDTVDAELRNFGIFERFDAVFSTADIGFAKPDPRAFQHVVDALGVDPVDVLFTDDSAGKLAGAAELGMTTHHFTGIGPLQDILLDAGFIASATPR